MGRCRVVARVLVFVVGRDRMASAGNGNTFPTNYSYRTSPAPWTFQGYHVASASPPPHASAGLPVDSASLALPSHDGALSNFRWSLPVPAVPHIGKRDLPPLPVAESSPSAGPARKAVFTQRATGDGSDRQVAPK